MGSDISIKVNVGDRIYPLKINSAEEENVRKASKLLNERILFFEQNFSVKDKIDAVAMAALEYAIDAINQNKNVQHLAQQPSVDLSQISQALQNLQTVLEK